MTTARLLATDPYPSAFRLATQPAFLRASGQGRISTLILSQYLSQDRLYQHAYVRFVGQLLSKLRFETATTTTGSIERRIMDTLIDALVGIQRELRFFEAVAVRYGFGLEVATTTVSGPTPITRAYADFFANVSGPGASLLEGLVALWGTEKCYLEAWRYARDFISPADTAASVGSYERDADGGAIRKELLPNWTSEAFGEFVEGTGVLIDEVAAAERKRLGDEGEWKVMESRCDEVWRQILWLEERFWPDVEGEGTE
jgi:thiaminase